MPLGESGGLFLLSINGQKVCDYVAWGFASCAVALLQNFKSYPRDWSSNSSETNWSLLEKYHPDLFLWLVSNGPSCDNWRPREFLMALSPNQTIHLPTMLKDPRVKLVDHWKNKSHGGNKISLFRISLDKDFT